LMILTLIAGRSMDMEKAFLTVRPLVSLKSGFFMLKPMNQMPSYRLGAAKAAVDKGKEKEKNTLINNQTANFANPPSKNTASFLGLYARLVPEPCGLASANVRSNVCLVSINIFLISSPLIDALTFRINGHDHRQVFHF